MKILELIPSLPSGGAERLVVDLCNQMVEMGHEVLLATVKDVYTQGNDFYLHELSNRVRLINLALSDGFHLKCIEKINHLIASEKPDVAHIHLVQDYCFFAFLLYYKQTKFFVTIHIDIAKFLGNTIKKHIVRGFIVNVLSRLKLLHYVTISKQNFDDMKAKYPYAPCDLIYNGRKTLLPTFDFDNAKKEIEFNRCSKDSLIFIHIARCVKQKNQKLLIDSFNRIISEGVVADLFVIGSGFLDTDEGMELQKMAGQNIHFLGTRTNIGDYLMCSDAFVLSSLYEGMPISLIEALSCGIPIISTPVCGVVDVVRSGENGFISKNFSVSSFVEALKMFIRNKDKLQKQTQLEAKSKMYDIEKTALSYIELFNK